MKHLALSLTAAAICMAADGAAGAPTEPAPPSPVAEFEFPQFGDTKKNFDCSVVPAETRLDFLKTGLRGYIANRLNSAMNRHAKEPLVVAWTAYNEAQKADPLQSIVAKPDKEAPAAPDYEVVYARAVEDLTKGNVRRAGGALKARVSRDPLTSTVTGVVVRAVYDSKRAVDPKYSFLTARKEVGVDGIAYLNAAIDAKVAAAPEAEQAALRTQLEKQRDTKYINPAKAMLGQTTDKKSEGLPSIL